jgi:hypothetical protein
VIGLIGVRQPDRVQVELMKVDRVRLLRMEIGRIAIEDTACCAGLVLRRAEIAADLDPAGEMSRHFSHQSRNRPIMALSRRRI